MLKLWKPGAGALLLASMLALAGCGGGGGDSVTGWIGIKQFGVAGVNTYGQSVVTDASGNVYVAGITYGGLDGQTLTGISDFYITKYNNSGTQQYTRQLGAAGKYTRGYSVATDVSGTVVVAGDTTGGLNGNFLTGVVDSFAARYNSAGVKLYVQQFGVVGKYTYGQSVATDANGNVFVAGTTNGGLDGQAVTGISDFFVTKYNSGGMKQFTKLLGVAGKITVGNCVVTDVSGNVYVAGNTAGGLDGNTLAGIEDFYVTKYNSSGVKQYTKQLGVAGKSTFGQSIATDVSGNVYVAGFTNGGLDGNVLIGIYDFFITKFDSNGVKQYTKQLGVAERDAFANAVATDASGNVYVAGRTTGSLDGNTQSGTSDFFVTKFDSYGVKQYTRQFGTSGKITSSSAVATDTSGNVYVTGYTAGGLDGNTLTGLADAFVAKFNSAGVKQ